MIYAQKNMKTVGLGFFLSYFYFFLFCFFPLKEEKANQSVPLARDRNELNLAIDLQLCCTSPLVYFLLIIFPGGKESSPSACFADGAYRACYLLLGCQTATMPELFKASRASVAFWRSWQAASQQIKAKNKLSGSYHWDESEFPLSSFWFCTLKYSNIVFPISREQQ